MKRRTAILSLGGLVAGGGAAMGTGAFTSVEANRVLEVAVENDENAYLALLPATTEGSAVENSSEGGRTPRAQDTPFARIDEETGRLELTVNALNSDAVTEIPSLFRIENRGTDEVGVYLDVGEGSANPDVIDFFGIKNGSRFDLGDEESPVPLDVGDEAIVVGMSFDTHGIGPDDPIADTIVINGVDPNRGENR